MLQFINPDTAKNFECLVDADRMVHNQQVYSGKLSGITPAMAKAMLSRGSNLIKEKPVAAAPVDEKPAPAASKPGKAS